MRWKYKDNKPKCGDWRIKTRFAFFPVKTSVPNDETVIWLERYRTNDRFEDRRPWGGGLEWSIVSIAPYEHWNEK